MYEVTILVLFPAQNGQRGSGHKTEQGSQVDGCGCRLKFLILSTGSVSTMRSIGMPNIFCCLFLQYAPLSSTRSYMCGTHQFSVPKFIKVCDVTDYMFQVTQLQEIVFIVFYSLLHSV